MVRIQQLGFIVGVLFSTSVFASGYSKPTWGGARAIGLGGAFVGVANDATALWHNASGLSFIEDEHLLYLAVEATHATKIDYTPLGGATEKGKHGFYPVPNIAYINNSIKNLSLGAGAVFTYASGGKFSSTSANPLVNPDEGVLYSLELMLSGAYKLTDYLSVSAALRVVRNALEAKGLTSVLSESPLVLDTANDLSTTGWAMGGSFGLTIKPADWLQLGAQYRTKLKFDLDGDVELATLGNSDITLEQTLPAILTAGFSARANQYLMFAFQYDYEFNDQINEIKVSTNALGSLPSIAQGFMNTHTFHFGTEISPSENFSILAGYVKEFNDGIPDPVINRVFGDLEANEFSFGLEYQLTKKIRSLATYHARVGKRVVEPAADVLQPSTTDAWVSTFVLGINYSI
ncbi:MAG: outer membrane protein transport protein [Bdellovibrionales bacterium]|nr:outer membrane protein transport protein [Bdellovibrionales bacterium]